MRISQEEYNHIDELLDRCVWHLDNMLTVLEDWREKRKMKEELRRKKEEMRAKTEARMQKEDEEKDDEKASDKEEEEAKEPTTEQDLKLSLFLQEEKFTGAVQVVKVAQTALYSPIEVLLKNVAAKVRIRKKRSWNDEDARGRRRECNGQSKTWAGVVGSDGKEEKHGWEVSRVKQIKWGRRPKMEQIVEEEKRSRVNVTQHSLGQNVMERNRDPQATQLQRFTGGLKPEQTQSSHTRITQFNESSKRATYPGPNSTSMRLQEVQLAEVKTGSSAASSSSVKQGGKTHRVPDVEIARRRELELCFTCVEKYSPIHICRIKHLPLLLSEPTDEEEDETLEPIPTKEDSELEGAMGETHIGLSLNSIAGFGNSYPMKVRGPKSFLAQTYYPRAVDVTEAGKGIIPAIATPKSSMYIEPNKGTSSSSAAFVSNHLENIGATASETRMNGKLDEFSYFFFFSMSTQPEAGYRKIWSSQSRWSGGTTTGKVSGAVPSRARRLLSILSP